MKERRGREESQFFDERGEKRINNAKHSMKEIAVKQPLTPFRLPKRRCALPPSPVKDGDVSKALFRGDTLFGHRDKERALDRLQSKAKTTANEKARERQTKKERQRERERETQKDSVERGTIASLSLGEVSEGHKSLQSRRRRRRCGDSLYYFLVSPLLRQLPQRQLCRRPKTEGERSA